MVRKAHIFNDPNPTHRKGYISPTHTIKNVPKTSLAS